MTLIDLLRRALPVLLIASFATGALAQDQRAEIRGLLQQRDAEIKTLLGREGVPVPDAQRKRLQAVINDVIDFQAMGTAALGPFWKTLTPAQQGEFVQVFRDIVRGQSTADLDAYRATVSYESITVTGNTAEVVTQTVYKEVPAAVSYKLVNDGTTWRATDIVIDDVSTVDGYARSFQTMIRKKGFDTLMERLRARLESMNKAD